MKRNEEENWTSVSTGYATFSAEDISHYDKSDNTTPDNMLLSGDVRYYGNPMNWESTKGDLISREALKKAITEKLGIYLDGTLNNRLLFSIIDNTPTAELDEMTQDLIDKVKVNVGLAQPIKDERPQSELKEYKPLELDYNVKSAVENLKTAYWSNDTEKYAKAFTEAEQIIVNAICHYGYIVKKGDAENDI